MASERMPKREYNGQYAYDGRLERVCVCGHTLADHGAGSPPDCLVYSFSERDRVSMVGGLTPDCGCLKFRQSRKKERV